MNANHNQVSQLSHAQLAVIVVAIVPGEGGRQEKGDAT
jgi:hypothetical protein